MQALEAELEQEEPNEYDPDALMRRRAAANEDQRQRPPSNLPPWKPPAVAAWIEDAQRPILERWDAVLRNLDHPKRAAMGKTEYGLAKAEWRCRWSEARIAMWEEVAAALQHPPMALANLDGGLYYFRQAFLASLAEGERCEAEHPKYVKERTRLRMANAQAAAARATGVEIAKGNLELAVRKLAEQTKVEERRHAGRPKTAEELERHMVAVARITAKLLTVEQLRAAFSEPETADPELE